MVLESYLCQLWRNSLFPAFLYASFVVKFDDGN